MSWRERLSEDRGETLLELVVAIVILGTCVVAIGAGIALSIKISDVHRKQAVAQEFLHNYAEAIQNSYAPCNPGPPNYASGLPTPANAGPWKPVNQSSFKYWNGSVFVAGCPGSDTGLQQVTLELQSQDGFVDESIVVAVRKLT